MVTGSQLRAVWGLVGGYMVSHISVVSAVPIYANEAERDGGTAGQFLLGALFTWFAVGLLMKPKS